MKSREALHRLGGNTMGMGPGWKEAIGWETVLHASLVTEPQPVIGMWTHGMNLP